MNQDYPKIREMLRQINFQEMLWGTHVFGSWRNTLSIYELDKDIIDSVVKSPIPNDTPISIFKRLHGWCLFLKYPEKSVKTSRLLETGEIVETYFDGFWANFDQLYDVKTKTTNYDLTS